MPPVFPTREGPDPMSVVDIGQGQGSGRRSSADYPAAPGQVRLFLLSRLEPESDAAYIFPAAIRLHGPLAVSALRRAIAAVVRRHDPLRTGFHASADGIYQSIAPALRSTLPVVDLSETPRWKIESELLRHARAHFSAPFDLSRPGLHRAKLVRVAADEHVLLIAAHHIVWDAWSWGIYWKELCKGYNAYIQGDTPAFPPLSARFIDVVMEQRQRLDNGGFGAHERYWLEKLAPPLPVLDLPTDCPRPARQHYRGDTISIDFDLALSKALDDLALRLRASPFVLALAAYKTLLHRYTGDEDVVVGAPYAGRHSPRSRDLIGFFVNTLALRTNLAGDPQFSVLVERVRETALGAHAHQDYPFDELISKINPERYLDRAPMFQTMFMFRDVALDGAQPFGIQAKLMDLSRTTAKYDFTMSICRVAGHWRVSLEYSTDLFTRGKAARLLGHYQALIAHAAQAPRTPISRLCILTPPELRALLSERNRACLGDERDTVRALFARRVRETPDALALIDGNERMSFAQLDARARRLANYLASRGVGERTVVAIALPRSSTAVVAILAAIKLRALYLPLDHAYPVNRLTELLTAAGANVVIAKRTQPDLLIPASMQWVDPEADGEAIGRAPVDEPEDAGSVDDSLYLIYTSGSTGRPKGVVATQRGLVDRWRWLAARYPYQAGEVACFKTSLGFVDAVAELFAPLLGGIPNVIVPDEVVRDPVRFVTLLHDYGVTRLVAVPSFWRTVMDTVPDLGQRLWRLRMLILSGETLSADLARRTRRVLPPGCTILNIYGCTETSADATYHEICAENAISPTGASAPIGRPLDHARVYILDRYRQPLPVGVPGEIYVGGSVLAAGYHQAPALTSERFVDVSLPDDTIERLYRTGDRGRYRDDGVIEFLGRTDQQIKIRGCRIELNEVELALRAHPAAAEAVVVAGDWRGELSLAAYVRLVSGGDIDVPRLRDHLAARLPAYMVPDTIQIVDEWPLLSNGKIDRVRLATTTRSPSASPGAKAPRSRTERAIADTWKELLGIGEVSLSDTFVGLGGHSLLAMRCVALLAERHDVRVDPMALLVKRLEELAAACQAGE